MRFRSEKAKFELVRVSLRIAAFEAIPKTRDFARYTIITAEL